MLRKKFLLAGIMLQLASLPANGAEARESGRPEQCLSAPHCQEGCCDYPFDEQFRKIVDSKITMTELMKMIDCPRCLRFDRKEREHIVEYLVRGKGVWAFYFRDGTLNGCTHSLEVDPCIMACCEGPRGDPAKVDKRCDLAGSIYVAIAAGNHQLVSEILQQGVDVNHRDENGETPLIHACYSAHYHNNGNIALIRLLLENGANPNARNQRGLSTLEMLLDHTRISRNYDRPGSWVPITMNLVKLLLDNGATVTPGVLEAAKPRRFLIGGESLVPIVKHNPDYDNEKKIYHLIKTHGKR
jgi:hypothetical protein